MYVKDNIKTYAIGHYKTKLIIKLKSLNKNYLLYIYIYNEYSNRDFYRSTSQSITCRNSRSQSIVGIYKLKLVIF